ncbi:DNA-binding response regulator, LytR/AlgR family [Tenacibaculum sp. MAR_2009_124]|uniref:LytR/AlgR family response regulator transcription factor n=1 Tax=Tenacibaculum sp. MAR_2009_124 TaxID=1250059 RepID=UPI000897FB37|nr:LytTR family DNA-binding domain-containing protein [Tenacibaculum sp. MAR_2009_124]SED20857.1 DNA-binding response regulator, LytR/AlgR family [Tenacibaculum sp. MAR_2009_124]
MKVRCLIVDDEPLAVQLIQKHIERIESLEVSTTCNNALKAFEILNTQEIDLMFLDIKMPNITGLDFLKTIKNPPKTIFTTAYRDYAIESYDLDVVDYLLKPITFERFFKSVDRFLRNKKQNVSELEVLSEEREFKFLKSGNKHHKVFFDDILFVESIKDYVRIHLVNDKRIVVKYKIGDMERDLKKQDFFRVHRSYIINKKRITAFSSNEIEIDSIEVPIGASYKEEVNTFLNTVKEL